MKLSVYTRSVRLFCMALTLLLIALGAASCSASHTPEEETTAKGSNIIFVIRDEDYNAFEDEEYLEYDRQIYLTDAYGTTIVLDDETVTKQNPAVQTLYGMINSAIRGNVKAYNALFSSNYYENHERVESFTMQPIYDTHFTFVRATEVVEKGNSYMQYEYEVSYKICWNDGTLRRDIGHHESKKQYFVLSDSTGRDVLIDQILEYKYKN